MISLPINNSGCRFEHEAMNCLFTFVLDGGEPDYLAQAAVEAGERLEYLESALSLYRENSDVSRINAAAPGTVLRIAEETAECLAVAMRVSAQTEGAYHPFVGAEAMRAKGQDLPHGVPVAEMSMQACVVELDLERALVSKRSQGALLDLGGVGKGFALDCLRTLLMEDWEIPAGLLVAGGSSILGYSSDGFAPWTVQFSDGGALPALDNAALGSSGLGFQPEHIIDPSTQRPVAQPRQVCVHAPSAAEADALATAAMVIPRGRLPAIFGNREGLSLYLKNHDDSRTIGPYFDGSVRPTSSLNPNNTDE